MVEHRAHLVVEERDLADDQSTQQEEADQRQPQHDGRDHRPAHARSRAQIRPRCSGPEANAPTVHTAASTSVAG